MFLVIFLVSNNLTYSKWKTGITYGINFSTQFYGQLGAVDPYDLDLEYFTGCSIGGVTEYYVNNTLTVFVDGKYSYGITNMSTSSNPYYEEFLRSFDFRTGILFNI